VCARWRRLSTGRQALFTLAHLRNGHTCAQLVAGLGIGTTTAYRHINEAVAILAALAPTLAEALRSATAKASVLLDGTPAAREAHAWFDGRGFETEPSQATAPVPDPTE
jgi:hypothetical protein